MLKKILDREMQQAEAEGVDEKEKAKRVNKIFAMKNLSSTTMTNAFGLTSHAAKGIFFNLSKYGRNAARILISAKSCSNNIWYNFDCPNNIWYAFDCSVLELLHLHLVALWDLLVQHQLPEQKQI